MRQASIYNNRKRLFFILLIGCISTQLSAIIKTSIVQVNNDSQFQTIEGFGASLAYYEGWLTAHPNKAQIYDAIFNDLNLTVLRVRNAYNYDAGMINRVSEFMTVAQRLKGRPIKLMVTSWGPPAYLKSNNDKSNGGTIKFSKVNGSVVFDYNAFALWWSQSLDEYNAKGIYPDYISIQNEPELKTSYESCRLSPTEKITATDTIAGYNKALEAVYTKIATRTRRPQIYGPEVTGIGYSTVQNYVNALNVKYLSGINHHLYHGVDELNPWISTEFSKLGAFQPSLPHFQTEYYKGDWFALSGLIYKSLYDENACGYLYWSLVWDGSGLVAMNNPWDKTKWTDPTKGYTISKSFYAFKQFSAFVQPGWKRTASAITNTECKMLSFINSAKDSAVLILINPSTTDTVNADIRIPNYTINKSSVYRTTETENCIDAGQIIDNTVHLYPRSISTVKLCITRNPSGLENLKTKVAARVYPNPFSDSATVEFDGNGIDIMTISVLNSSGKTIREQTIKQQLNGKQSYILQRKNLSPGTYFYKIATSQSTIYSGKFVIKSK